MNVRLAAGLLYLCGTIAVFATPLDEKVQAFVHALKETPPTGTTAAEAMDSGRPTAIEELTQAIHAESDRGGRAEGITSLLISLHPNDDKVQKAGESLLRELQIRRAARTKTAETKSAAVLEKVKAAVTGAKKPADLDAILESLKPLADPHGEGASIYSAKVSDAFLFVTQWQNYLSATASGDGQKAEQALRVILDSRQITSPTYFPRSKLLELQVRASGRNPQETEGKTDAQAQNPLGAVKSVDEVQMAVYKEIQIHTAEPDANKLDWVAVQSLDKARQDVLSGLPVTLDLKETIRGGVIGSDVSRVLAMEFIVILPYYFKTEVSDPPKPKENVRDYMDRLAAKAGASGNLALLQRVISVQVATSSDGGAISSDGTQKFLAGLTQEAAGQFAPAVTSYENALKTPDRFLPIKILGDRLADIKAAHPEDYAKGLETAMTPTPSIIDPRNPYAMGGINPYYRPGMYPPNYQPEMPATSPNYVLAIPMSIVVDPPKPAPSAPKKKPAKP